MTDEAREVPRGTAPEQDDETSVSIIHGDRQVDTTTGEITEIARTLSEGREADEYAQGRLFEGSEVDVQSTKVGGFHAVGLDRVGENMRIGTIVRVSAEVEIVGVGHIRDPKSRVLERVHHGKALDGGTIVAVVSEPPPGRSRG